MSNAQIGRDVRAALSHFMVRVLDPITRMLWLTLVAEQDDLVSEGVLRGGSKESFCRLFSRWFLFDETQVLNSVETLLETGLLTQRSDGSLGMAPLAGTRHGAGKPRNLGGRPKKGESASDAYARRQREEEVVRQQRSMRLISVIDGGLGDGQAAIPGNSVETRDETPPRERVAAAAFISEESKQQLSPEPEREVSTLAASVAEASGISLPAVDLRVLRSWLADGATPGLILDVVREVAARATYPSPPDSVGYFAKRLHEVLVKPRAAPPGTGAPLTAAEADWQRKVTAELNFMTARRDDAWNAWALAGKRWQEPPMPTREMAEASLRQRQARAA